MGCLQWSDRFARHESLNAIARSTRRSLTCIPDDFLNKIGLTLATK
jgi:hypothetical protein